MKRLLAYMFLVLVLTFSPQSWTKADNIRDFQIEGISLKDSALKHFKKKEFNLSNGNNPSVVYDKYCPRIYNTYPDGICYYTKKNDKKYIIESIAGFIPFPNNIKGCYSKQIEIDKEIGNFFPNTKKKIYEYKNPADRSGQSFEKDIIYTFADGSEAGTACLEWGKKYKKQYPGAQNHLQVFLDTKEYAKWLKDGMK
jgi:hypothetical protein